MCESLDGDGHQQPGHPRRKRTTHNVASVAPYAEVMGEVPISEATGHLDQVANESAATAGIEAAEDAADIAAAQAAMAEPGEDIPAEGSGPS